MKNGLDDAGESVASPPLKKIKLELIADDDAYLLSTASENRHDRQPGPRKKRGGRPKSTIEDRALVLLNDPRISAVEPSKVLCRMCGHWIQLFKHIEFAPSNWRTHAERCEARTSWSAKVRAEPSKKFTLTIPSLSSLRQQMQKQSEAGPSSAPVTNVVKSPVLEAPKPPDAEVIQPVKAPRINDKAETRRKSVLQADIRIVEFDAHRVKCKMCNAWVKLHNVRTYDLWNWQRHAEKCELRPGNMDPNVLKARYNAEQQQSALVNHDYSLRQRPAEAPPLSTTESSVSVGVRRKRRLSAHGTANHAAGPSLRHEASEKSHGPGMPLSSAVGSAGPPGPPANADGLTMISVKPEPFDSDRDMLHGMGRASLPDAPTSAGSLVLKRRRGRTVDERRQALMDDPRTGQVLPHEVWCKMCSKWVKLYRDVQYIEANWIRHAEKCYMRALASGDPQVQQWRMPKISGLSYVTEYDESTDTLRPAPPPPPPASPISLVSPVASTSRPSLARAAARTRQVIKVEDDGDGSASAPVVAAPRKAPAARVKDEMTAEERRNVLVGDGRCKEIEPQSVFCMMCNRRVGLHAKKDYSLSNWFKHARSCEKADGRAVQRRPEVQRTTFTASAPVPGHSGQVRDAPPRLTLTYKGESEFEDLAAMSRGQSNAESRKAQLLADPRVMDVEPNRIRCKVCNKWLKLNEIMSYAPYNWQKHIERCIERNDVDEDYNRLSATIVHREVVSTPGQSARKKFTPQQRLERLQADPRIKNIEKHRARCALCNKWVKLQTHAEYDPHNWYAHIKKCEPKVDRVMHPDTDDEMAPALDIDTYDASETGSARILARRQLFVNDVDAIAVEPNRVLCGICKQWIKLRDDKPYIPFNWAKHKGKCERRHGLTRSDSAFTPITPSTGGSSSVVKEEPLDDNSVFASSAGSVRKSTADAEREAQLRADPRQAGVEPGRVLCGMCNSWIKLNLSNGFLPGNWTRHAARCEKKTQNGKFPDAVRKREPAQPELTTAEVIDLEADGLDMDIFGFVELGKIISAFEPSISSTEYARTVKKAEEQAAVQQLPTNYNVPTLRARALNNVAIATAASSRMNSPAPASRSQSVVVSGGESSRRPHRSEVQRKGDLESDPRTKVVLSDKILCALCDRWIQMRKDVAYSPQNWLKHAGICEKRHGFVNRTSGDKKPKIEFDTDLSEFEDERTDVNAVLPFSARRKQRSDKIADVPVPALKPVDWTSTPTAVYSSSDSENDVDDSLPVTPQPGNQPNSVVARKKPGRKPKVKEEVVRQLSLAQNEQYATAETHSTHTSPMPMQHSRDAAYRTEFQAAQASQHRSYSILPTSMHQMMSMGSLQPSTSARSVQVPSAKPAPFVVPMASHILPHLLPRQMAPSGPNAAVSPQPQMFSVPSPFLDSVTPPVPAPASITSNSMPSTPGIPEMLTPPPTMSLGKRSSSVASSTKSKSAHHAQPPTVPSVTRTSSVPAPQPMIPLRPTFSMMPQDPGVLQLAPPSFVRNSPAQILSTSTSQSSIISDSPSTMGMQVDKDGVLLIRT